jgi:hypothetical protein
MTPHEAASLADEPNWITRHAANLRLFPAELDHEGFERTLREWRLFHGSKMSDGRLMPASAVDAMVALAHLRIFPPRSVLRDLPRDGINGFQYDDHMWLSIRGEQWRIRGIEDRQLILEKGFEESETMVIDLATAKWGSYVEAAAAVLEARA